MWNHFWATFIDFWRFLCGHCGHRPWRSLAEGGEDSCLPNCQTNLVIALYTLSQLFSKFINTTAYHLGRYDHTYGKLSLSQFDRFRFFYRSVISLFTATLFVNTILLTGTYMVGSKAIEAKLVSGFVLVLTTRAKAMLWPYLFNKYLRQKIHQSRCVPLCICISFLLV